ncbi:MAG: STAS domain-containing protein [Candidatus Omnitrophota bacterium]
MLKFLADIFKDVNGKPLPCVKEIIRVGKLSIMRLQGDIDLDTVQIVSENIKDEMLDDFDRNILLDFQEVANVDSSTLAYLITLLDKLKKKQRKLGIIHATDRLTGYLQIEKVETLIRIYNSEEEAVRDLV